MSMYEVYTYGPYWYFGTVQVVHFGVLAAPGAFDYEQVNLAAGPAKAEHASIIAALAAQLKAHYAVDVQ